MKNPNFLTEKETIIFLQSGSVDAFENLFEAYSQKLFHFAVTYLKSDAEAEDVVQEVFLKLWEHRGNIKTDTSFQSYLFTIAFNSIKKNFNKKLRQDRYRIELFEMLSVDNNTIELQPDFEGLIVKMDQLIDQMPIRRKEIFLKRKKEGKSVHVIADEMGISPKTVENQITEAMHYLKKEFDKDKASGILFFCMFLD